MIPYSLADHLWQSTWFAVAAGLLALLLSGYQARIRHHLWFAASMKFLVPFAWLSGLGSLWEWESTPTLATPPFAQPFSTPLAVTLGPPDAVSAATANQTLLWTLIGLWLCGTAVILIRWGLAWRNVVRDANRAVEMPLGTPIPVRMCATRREPGLFGWWRPVILLPEGILDRLDAPQLNAVIAHELAHWRRRDNWTATVHMAVTAIFWFHPLVWWIGARLVSEREQACDEEVIRQGNSPHDYATGIVTVCRHYLESPLPCTSGVSGGASCSLQQRIRTIFAARAARDLTRSSRAALAIAAALTVMLPVVSGMRMQNPEEIPADGPRFEVASIRLNEQTNPGFRLLQQGGGRVVSSGVSVAQYIAFAYNLEDFQVVGGPRWMTTDRYNLQGKMEGFRGEFATNAEFRQAFKPLLRDRFGLVFHDENREGSVYFLTIDKTPKMKVHTAGDEGARAAVGRGYLRGTRLSTADLARDLARHLGRPVIDRTGLKDFYDITLEWNPDSDDPNSSSTRPMLLTALREQLGLRLESGRGPVRHVVVDQLKRPSEN